MRIMEQYYNQQKIIDDLIREERRISNQYINQINSLCKEISFCMSEINSSEYSSKIERLLKKENHYKEEIKEISKEFTFKYEFLKVRTEAECFKLKNLTTLIELSKNFDRSYVKN